MVLSRHFGSTGTNTVLLSHEVHTISTYGWGKRVPKSTNCPSPQWHGVNVEWLRTRTQRKAHRMVLPTWSLLPARLCHQDAPADAANPKIWTTMEKCSIWVTLNRLLKPRTLKLLHPPVPRTRAAKAVKISALTISITFSERWTRKTRTPWQFASYASKYDRALQKLNLPH